MAAAFSPDCKRIVTGGREATLTLWDAEKATEIRTFRRHENDIQGAAFSPDGIRIASGGYDNLMKMWDAEKGTEIGSSNGPKSCSIGMVSFSPDGQRILSIAANVAEVWNVDQAKPIPAQSLAASAAG